MAVCSRSSTNPLFCLFVLPTAATTPIEVNEEFNELVSDHRQLGLHQLRLLWHPRTRILVSLDQLLLRHELIVHDDVFNGNVLRLHNVHHRRGRHSSTHVFATYFTARVKIRSISSSCFSRGQRLIYRIAACRFGKLSCRSSKLHATPQATILKPNDFCSKSGEKVDNLQPALHRRVFSSNWMKRCGAGALVPNSSCCPVAWIVFSQCEFETVTMDHQPGTSAFPEGHNFSCSNQELVAERDLSTTREHHQRHRPLESPFLSSMASCHAASSFAKKYAVHFQRWHGSKQPHNSMGEPPSFTLKSWATNRARTSGLSSECNLISAQSWTVRILTDFGPVRTLWIVAYLMDLVNLVHHEDVVGLVERVGRIRTF